MRTSLSIFLNIGQLNSQCVYQGESGEKEQEKTRLALVWCMHIALTEGPTFQSVFKARPLPQTPSVLQTRNSNNICTQEAGGVEKV